MNKNRTFTKREAKHFVCNKCQQRFQAGDKAYSTAKNAYRHSNCPPLITTTVSLQRGDA